MESLRQGFRIGECEVRPEDGTVATPAGVQRIGPRPMQVLVCLAEHPGQVLSRAKLMAAVWGQAVVSDETLSRSIADLRRALGEGARETRYIETLARRGYRLKVMPVPLEAGPAEAAEPGSASAGVTATRVPRSVSLGAAALAVIAMLFGLWVMLAPKEPPAALELAANGIVVLPFVNLSDDPGLEFFSDGLTEELLNALAAQQELEVVARTSAFAFRGQDRDIREIGRQLGVANVVEGSVRRDGQRLRMTVQLIDARSGFHLFSKTYDRKFGDLLDIQEELALEVGATIAPKLANRAMWADGIRRATTPEALEHYLLGKHQQRKVTVESLAQAAVEFRAALDLDPDFALAHADLGITLALTSQYAERPIEDFSAEIEQLAAHALALEPRTAAAWHARGLLAFYERRLEDALDAFTAAQELDANATGSAAMKARTLHFMGRNSEAKAVTAAALRKDPLNLVLVNNHAAILRRLGEYGDAERWLRRSLDIDPGYLNAYWELGYLEWKTGSPRAAAEWFEQGIEKGIRQSLAFYHFGLILLDLGEFDRAKGWLNRAISEAVDPVAYLDGLMAWHVCQGDIEGLAATVHDYDARLPGHPGIAPMRAMAALYAGDARVAIREYEGLAGINSARLHQRHDMENGTWHALLLARARQIAGAERAVELSLAEIEKELAAFRREGGPAGLLGYYEAAIAALRGNPDAAISALDEARRAGWRRYFHALHDPLLAELRGLPAFESVLADVREDLEGQRLAWLP